MKTKLITVFSLVALIFLSACKKKQENSDEQSIQTEEIISTPKLKSVVVNDYEIHYLDIGKGNPVIFVHGGVGDYRTWEAQMKDFSEKYRVIAISRRYAYPNKQEANDANDYSVTLHAKDLTEVLKTLNLGPVHLVGHSYGAFTSLMTALEHPELVRSLTLGEPPVMSFLQYVDDGEKLGNDFAVNTFIPALEAFNKGKNEKAVELFIGGVLDDSLYYSKASQKQKDLMMDNAFGLKGVLSTENPFPPLSSDNVKALKIPTLLIKGDRSPRRLTVLTDVLANCIANSELKILSDASHGLEYENPIEFNNIVLDFIQKHKAQ